jgi:fatty acid desaturase
MSHWKHHLFLGTAQDTETSYVTPITLRKILYVASGLYLLGVFLRYARVYRGLDKKSSGKGNSQAAYFRSLAFMIVCQCALTAAWACWVSIPSALAWVLGYVLFGPLLVWLRQTMEHRSMDAGSMPVYEFSRYAPTNRLFGSDIFSRFFGAAGFNKHLLHHWDPSVSYTCFPQMEMFLMDTDLREQLQSCSTTYWATFNAMNASRF